MHLPYILIACITTAIQLNKIKMEFLCTVRRAPPHKSPDAETGLKPEYMHGKRKENNETQGPWTDLGRSCHTRRYRTLPFFTLRIVVWIVCEIVDWWFVVRLAINNPVTHRRFAA